MSKTRLEAFTDAVIAIVMTILVLELKTPEHATLEALWELRFQFFTYLVSFLTLAIYWNNHHHLFQASRQVSGKVLWLNILLILCMSLFPLTTAWMGENVFERAPELAYAAVMLTADVVWLCLARALAHVNGVQSTIAVSLKASGYRKSAISISLVALGMAVGVFLPMAALVACLASLVPWVVPDRDIERRLHGPKDPGQGDTQHHEQP
ncbi:MAG: TMEM175 family protein [Coriobacteriales bacterium]|jgi:uncharacterized membrane protein|nr:TMEM175 family protein [Coriobacteriales bacterium]